MSADQLRDLLEAQTDALRRETLDKQGDVPAEQLDNLDRLDRLVAISEKLRPAQPRPRWRVPAILGTCLAVVSLLLFVRCPRTEIELNSRLTDLRFTLAEQVLLADAVQFEALGVAGLREIRRPDAQPHATKTFKVAVEQPADEDDAEAGSAGAISLTDLLLPAGARVGVSCSDIPDQYRLSLELPEQHAFELKVNVKGSLELTLPGVGVEPVTYAGPAAIRMLPGSPQVVLDLTLPAGGRETFAFLPAKDLILYRIEDYMDTRPSLPPRRVPAILSGALYLAALDGRKYPLREGEDLRFKKSEGLIRALKLERNQLALTFHGDVQGMTSGWQKTRVPLMPTVLDWLRARHGLALLWGTTLFLFGVVNQVMRWWKTSR
jgi:hypothetical protein